MSDRIDVLGQRPERLTVFRGRVLESADDLVLDAIAAEAAAELKAPACLVSLVLDRLQIFRASVGLAGSGPSITRPIATSRSVSTWSAIARWSPSKTRTPTRGFRA